jgi:tricarballylate dehydrogenase
LARRLTEEAAGIFKGLTEKGLDWEYQAPHPRYTAGRVWLDGETTLDDLVKHYESLGGEVRYDAMVQDVIRAGSVSGVSGFGDER